MARRPYVTSGILMEPAGTYGSKFSSRFTYLFIFGFLSLI